MLVDAIGVLNVWLCQKELMGVSWMYQQGVLRGCDGMC